MVSEEGVQRRKKRKGKRRKSAVGSRQPGVVMPRASAQALEENFTKGMLTEQDKRTESKRGLVAQN